MLRIRSIINFVILKNTKRKTTLFKQCKNNRYNQKGTLQNKVEELEQIYKELEDEENYIYELEEKRLILLTYCLIVIIGTGVLKIWALSWKLIKRLNNKYFPHKSGLEEFYFAFYGFLYILVLGLYSFYAGFHYLEFFVILVLASSFIISVLIFKRINPALANIIGNVTYAKESIKF